MKPLLKKVVQFGIEQPTEHEQTSLAIAKHILDRETDDNTIDQEITTRAIEAFEYVEPFKNTEAGKPLFSRVLRMLAGSNNNASMHAHWSPEAINQFAEYYKDSKYQDYKFRFVSLAPSSLRLIDLMSKELPGLLGEDDLSWLPRGIVSHEGESMYLADYTPEFTDENVKNYPADLRGNVWARWEREPKSYPADLRGKEVLVQWGVESHEGESMSHADYTPISTINPPMLSTSNQQDISSGVGLSTLGTVAAVAAVGAVLLAKKLGSFGFFRGAAPVASQQQLNEQVDNIPKDPGH